MLTGFGLACVVMVCAAQADPGQTMRGNYTDFIAREAATENPLPFLLSSGNDDKNSAARIRYFLKNVSFDTLMDRLGQPAEWCEFIPLHLNIKACTFFQQGNQWYLRFYLGVKEYAAPGDARLLELKFSTARKGDVFVVGLYAEHGPLRSSNIRFDLRAIAVEEEDPNGVYLEFDMSSTPGLAEKLAKVYLSTVARSKIGFSIVGETWRSQPRYVHGRRAAIERNLVRYLLAIETYFSTLDLENDNAVYPKRMERWYDATDKYPEQLYELDRSEYLSGKKRERENQDALQRDLSNRNDLDFRDKNH